MAIRISITKHFSFSPYIGDQRSICGKQNPNTKLTHQKSRVTCKKCLKLLNGGTII